MQQNNFKTLPKAVVWGFFILGILSAISFRTLMVFYRLNPSMVKYVWYFGIIGYVVFFLYRFIIANKRKRMINEFELLKKLKNGQNINDKEKQALIYILASINKSKEKWNYANIFFLSAIAVIVDLIIS